MYGDFTPEEKARLTAAGVDYDLEAAIRETSPSFEVTNIEKVLAFVTNNDVQDYPDYAWIIELVQPVEGQKYVLLEGWHDYTGWDCQSGATSTFGPSPRQLVGRVDTSDNKETFKEELLKQVNSHKQTTWYEQKDKEFGVHH